MSLTIQENIDLAPLCTMRVGKKARYFTTVTSKDDVCEAIRWCNEHEIPYFILGGGSNTIFTDTNYEGLVIKNEIKEFTIISDETATVTLKIGAGEEWDSVVARTVNQNLSGIEALSLIPGTAGATPVQNVGAYGQEIAQTLDTVEVYDTQNDEFLMLNNADCHFSYRDSIFKSEEKNRYVITAIILKLAKTPPPFPTFKGLIEYFNTKNNPNPTVQDIRKAVIEIRTSKLPDPKVLPNTGSFFENPIISQDLFIQIQKKYPEIIYFPLSDGKIKLFAGWLIDNCGLKGITYKNFGLYEKNALVIVHRKNGTYTELEEFTTFIKKTVEKQFGITLKQEPQTV